MTTVFIAGSISIKNLDERVKQRIDIVIAQGYSILVGDADGVDSSIQAYLQESETSNISVYCSGNKPRNNLGNWPVKSVAVNNLKAGSRAFYTAKDLQMAKDADFGLMIWDLKSAGTLSNVVELLERDKKSAVFVNKTKAFYDVGDISKLEELLTYMSPIALQKVDAKIGILKRIAQYKNEQPDLFA